MSAAALLMKLQDAGASVRAEEGDLVVTAPYGVLSPLVVSELRERKPLVLEVLTGRRCRYCEGALDWRRPAVAFADDTGAHLGCYEEAEVARLMAAAARAVAGVVVTSDDGELVEEALA